MHLAIDGIIFEIQCRGGISRLFATILPLLCDLDPSLQVTIYLAHQPRHPLPVHSQIQTRPILPLSRALRPPRFWRQLIPAARELALMLGVKRDENTVWHSTYYTYPFGRTLSNVVTVYDLVYEKFPHLFHPEDVKTHIAAKKRTLAAADRIICISEATAADVRTYYNVASDKIAVIYLAPAPTFRRLGDVEKSERPFLLYVGDRSPYKNFSILLAAYEQWKPAEPVDLVVVGRPWRHDEMKQLAMHHKRDRIRLLTDINDDRLAALYRAAFAFVYPSLYEGFGIPLLEAMACACPVVASRIPSTEEIAEGYPIYFDPTSVDDLIHAIDTAAVSGRDPARQALGQTVVVRYSWQQTARRTLNQYYAAAGLVLPDHV